MELPPDPAGQELIKRVEAAMQSLPHRTREIFLANRLDHTPYEEIARRTGLTVRQVERHMVRALVLLGRRLHGKPRSWWKFW